MIRAFLPKDAAAVAVGADDIAAEISTLAKDIELVRTGSRGMFWLEPLLEVEVSGVRYGFGPLETADLAGLIKAGLFDPSKAAGIDHPKSLGPVDQISWLARQTRLTFARCGVIDPMSLSAYEDAGGYKGLAKSAIARPPGHHRRSAEIRPPRPWRRGLPDRHQVENRA